jgi:hypothetical protein
MAYERSEEISQPLEQLLSHPAVTLTYMHFYDKGGSGIETAIKDGKQGLGLTKGSKKRFEAQQMIVRLGTLAYNVIVWARGWLVPHEPKVPRYGLKRMVRDVFHITGVLRNCIRVIPLEGKVRKVKVVGNTAQRPSAVGCSGAPQRTSGDLPRRCSIWRQRGV